MNISSLAKKDYDKLNEQAESEKDESKNKDDIFQLSDKDRERLEKLSERYIEFIIALHAYESSGSMFEGFTESAKEKLEVDSKCMKIASNLAKGLNVPSKDETYLSELLTNQVFNIKISNGTKKTISFIKISLKFLQKD